MDCSKAITTSSSIAPISSSYSACHSSLQFVVVVRKGPVLVAPLQETPRTRFALPLTRVFSGTTFGSALSSHMLLFPGVCNKGAGEAAPSHAALKGLERVLVHYYPLAGRLRPAAQHGIVEIVCNSQGVPFIEAHANITLEHLKRLDKMFWSDFQCPLPQEESAEVPALTVQVTMLACGAFVVSIRILHSLCDASGVLHFFHAWSECARGNAHISTVPIWGDVPLINLMGGPQRFHYTSLDLAHMGHLQQQEMEHVQYLHQETTPIASLSIPIDDITNLKSGLPMKVNKFEALAALFWRERAKALRLNPSSEVVLFFPAPVARDLPVIFYGPYALNCMVVSSVADLVQSDLSYAVGLIQRAKNRVVEDFAGCAKEFARLHSEGKGKGPPPEALLVTLLWDGAHEIDFGTGATPHAPDVVRPQSAVNVVALTGALEGTLEVVLTNLPPNLLDGLLYSLPQAQMNAWSSSKL